MKDNHLTKSTELARSKPTPFGASAKLVIGVGLSVLGLIGKAIRGAAGLLVNQPGNARTTGRVPMNKPESLQDSRDL